MFGLGCGNDDSSGGAVADKPIRGDGDAAIGDAVRLETVDTEVEVTVEGTDESVKLGEFDRPPEGGAELIAVDLAIDNIGEDTFGGSLFPAINLITSSDGQAQLATPGDSQCVSDFAIDVQIAPGDRRAGCVIFEIPKGEKAAAFQFSVDGGGGAVNTAEWDLR